MLLISSLLLSCQHLVARRHRKLAWVRTHALPCFGAPVSAQRQVTSVGDISFSPCAYDAHSKPTSFDTNTAHTSGTASSHTRVEWLGRQSRPSRQPRQRHVRPRGRTKLGEGPGRICLHERQWTALPAGGQRSLGFEGGMASRAPANGILIPLQSPAAVNFPPDPLSLLAYILLLQRSAQFRHSVTVSSSASFIQYTILLQ